MKKIYDITLTLTPELPTWPGEPGIQLYRTGSLEHGDSANVSKLEMMVHTGTHVDAPSHFLPNQPGVEELSLDALVGTATVIQIPEGCNTITEETLKAVDFRGNQRIIFKTRNSYYWQKGETTFQTGYVGLDASAAKIIVECGIRLVGIDYLSIAAYHDQIAPHKILLGGGIVILEGLDLSLVEAGNYLLCCLPLKLQGSDGAPARVVLIEQ
jgi:arylformamidase